MAQVCVMEFDKIDRFFKMLNSEVKLASIPTRGDKFTMDEKSIGYVFEVYDVHYADENLVDVYVVRISDITSYNSSKFRDIK